jgi:hypothetical protein
MRDSSKSARRPDQGRVRSHQRAGTRAAQGSRRVPDSPTAGPGSMAGTEARDLAGEPSSGASSSRSGSATSRCSTPGVTTDSSSPISAFPHEEAFFRREIPALGGQFELWGVRNDPKPADTGHSSESHFDALTPDVASWTTTDPSGISPTRSTDAPLRTVPRSATFRLLIRPNIRAVAGPITPERMLPMFPYQTVAPNTKKTPTPRCSIGSSASTRGRPPGPVPVRPDVRPRGLQLPGLQRAGPQAAVPGLPRAESRRLRQERHAQGVPLPRPGHRSRTPISSCSSRAGSVEGRRHRDRPTTACPGSGSTPIATKTDRSDRPIASAATRRRGISGACSTWISCRPRSRPASTGATWAATGGSTGRS